MIGYKKAAGPRSQSRHNNIGKVIVKLRTISKLIVRPYGGIKKLRAEKVKVLGIYSLRGTKLKLKTARSVGWGNATIVEYTVGKVTIAGWLDRDKHNECGAGINFFKTFREAADYLP